MLQKLEGPRVDIFVGDGPEETQQPWSGGDLESFL